MRVASGLGAILLVVMLAASVTFAGEVKTTALDETPEQREKRMEWWRDARFGMFIHWGVYAVPAGTYKGERIPGIGEWIMRRAEIPVSEYKEYAKKFNPVKYDPDFWAELAADAGMKYMVITSKHHDGFALFPSDVTDWDIEGATPYGKDLIGPLADAARDHGLKFGLYHSQAQDWTHPGGAKAGMKEGEGWCEAHKGDFDEYLKNIAKPQVREILTRYKPAVLWWDTPVWMNKERADLLRPLIGLRPGLITNNRLGGGYRGDFSTPEQHIPATGLDYDWETCMTMNGTWGYKSYDDNWKSTKTLVRNLIDIASKGGNYLLNVGPKPDGTIPQASIDRLREIGEWMDVYGESIYGTTASPCRRPAWGRITTEAGDDVSTLYLHVFDWPADGKLFVPVKNEPVGCHLMGEDREFKVSKDEAGLTVHLTAKGGITVLAPNPISSVVALKVKGEPEAMPVYVRQAEDGTFVMKAIDAEILGSGPQVERKGGEPNIGFWTEPGAQLRWQFKVKQPGGFDVYAEIACTGSSSFDVTVDGEKVSAEVSSTGNYSSFETVKLGSVKLDKGANTLKVIPKASAWNAINLRSVTLKPAE